MSDSRTQSQLNSDLIHAVREDLVGFVEQSLDAGADPNAVMDDFEVPVMFAVQGRRYSSVRNEVLELLLNRGADPQARDEAGNTLLHLGAAAGADGVVVQMLEAGVDPLTTNDRGLTPFQTIVDRTLHQAASRLEYAVSRPRVKLDETLTHDTLFGQDTLGDAPIDNALSWHMFPKIVEQLEKNGEPPITKADLMTCDKTQKPRIARAILGYQWDTVQDYLQERGEPITHEDFVESAPHGSQIATALMRREKLHGFFTPEYWQDKPLHELDKSYHSLDEESRDSVGNFHQLYEIKRQNERGLPMQRGR